MTQDNARVGLWHELNGKGDVEGSPEAGSDSHREQERAAYLVSATNEEREE